MKIARPRSSREGVEKTLEESLLVENLQQTVRELLARVEQLETRGSTQPVDYVDLKSRGGAVGRVRYDGSTGVVAERIR